MDAHRLRPIRQIAAERENDSARELAERHEALATQEQRLQELRGYAAEYAELPVGARVDAAALANRRAFVEKIDGAVLQQKHHVENARAHVDSERARLVLASREVAVLDRLAANYASHERVQLERREQKDLDDHAIRIRRAVRQEST